MTVVLVLGSAPMVEEAAHWPRAPFDRVVAINNAWRVRQDWDAAVYPWDFPPERQPVAGPGQQLVTEAEFVPAQNGFGGFVFAGATMAFTAGYWALAALKPSVIAVFGCDMHYPVGGKTHFYGNGAPDPLRKDITLRSLEAKSARLMVIAATQGCAMVNLSVGPSRLIFPRVARQSAGLARPRPWCPDMAAAALAAEAALGYDVPSGRYWEELETFDPVALDRVDELWMKAATLPLRQTA
jgi:hypothetical protein